MGTITRGFANFIGPDGKLQQGSLAAGVGGPAWQSVVVADGSTGLTAVAGRAYPINTTSGTITVTLPATPSAGDEIILLDYAGTFASNNLTISATPKINGSDNDVKLTTNREGTILVYIDSTQGWLAYSGVNEGTSPSLTDIPATYSVDFLVIAGGGSGGGGYQSGGGGAGGYRNSYSTETSGGNSSNETSLTFTQGVVYTVTVGAGGASQTTNETRGNSGVNSEISGTGISTITSTGGGGGGTFHVSDANINNGINGGSGGGAGRVDGSATGGSGTANQGFAGGNTSTSYVDPFCGGGGGGASAAGTSTSGATIGFGGNGLASSITGSSVTRAGGGGGGNGLDNTLPTGGTGGGGNGQDGDASAATAGTVNTGSGGGGAGHISFFSGDSGAGGKGVVILRIPTASYSGTTTGSPTVTTDGSDKVIVFNDSGSITG